MQTGRTIQVLFRLPRVGAVAAHDSAPGRRLLVIGRVGAVQALGRDRRQRFCVDRKREARKPEWIGQPVMPHVVSIDRICRHRGTPIKRICGAGNHASYVLILSMSSYSFLDVRVAVITIDIIVTLRIPKVNAAARATSCNRPPSTQVEDCCRRSP